MSPVDLTPIPADMLAEQRAFLCDEEVAGVIVRLAGNRTDLAIYPEATHVFDGFPTATGRHARTAIAAWLASCLGNHTT